MSNLPDHSVPVATPAVRPRTVKVIGVGGAGLQALAVLAAEVPPGVTLAGIHTDARKLAAAGLGDQLVVGARLTRGVGAGGDPELGRTAAESDLARLGELVAGVDFVIVVTGLGKGTGSGVAPVVARVAREAGALVLALATLPFEFEGTRRRQQAEAGLQQLRRACDAVVLLPNQKIAGLIDENTTFTDTFQITNRLLAEGVRGLERLARGDGWLAVDFGDLCNVVRGRQAISCFATAEARGENRVREVLEQLRHSPMLEDGRALAEADAVLVSVLGGVDLRQREVAQLMEQLNRVAEKAEVVMGAAAVPEAEGRLVVTVIAARRADPEAPAPAPREATEASPVPRDPETIESALGLESSRPGVRPTSRYVPPPPELTPEMQERVLRQAGVSARHRKKAARARQQMLPLEIVSKGRFARSEPSIHNGEDLDTPTYVRRGLALN